MVTQLLLDLPDGDKLKRNLKKKKSSIKSHHVLDNNRILRGMLLSFLL